MTTSPAVAHSDVFIRRLAVATERALLLDYDGTIAPFTPDRSKALPYVDVPQLLDCLISTCHTRVVLISGRAAREIPPLLGLQPCPEIWGSHGLERLAPDGSYSVARLPKATTLALSKATADLRSEGIENLLELKPGCVAVHWRGLGPAYAQEARTCAYRALTPIAAGSSELQLTEFDGGLELRPRGRNKGSVVRQILAELNPDAAVAYLGDDTTDEDAFGALADRGLTVLVRAEFRPTAAQRWIRPPEELVQFLIDWVRACGGDL